LNVENTVFLFRYFSKININDANENRNIYIYDAHYICIMDKEFVISYLKKTNYWWNTKKIDEVDQGIKREEYLQTLQEDLKLERIVCITGIRRSGKTTLLFQLIDTLLKNKVKPEHIVYIKLDDLLGKIEDIREITSIYQELTGIDPKANEIFFLFDEIHFFNKWQFQLKYFIDSKYKSKFIISGSSKTLLYKDASESLAGRIRFINMFPLTFKEFLKFNKIPLKNIETIDFTTIKKFYHDLLPNKETILHQFRQYLEVGGFPEWFKIKNVKQWYKVLVDDYLSLFLFKDIVFVFKIKDPILLEKLVHEVALFTTNRFNYTKLSNRLDADRETIKLYLYYLESSGLIFISEVYFKSKKARERIEKKIYFWEEGLRKALTLDESEDKSIENIVAWHTIKKEMKEKVFLTPAYWKNKYEVDFVLDGKKLIPIEVKYRKTPDDIKGLIEFAKKFDTKHNIVVTKDLLDKKFIDGKEILFIPAWLYLLVI